MLAWREVSMRDRARGIEEVVVCDIEGGGVEGILTRYFLDET